VFALPTEHRLLVPLGSWPDAGLMRLASVVTTDACVEFLAAEVLDGDDVEARVPMAAVRERCDRESVYYWGFGLIGRHSGIEHHSGVVQATENRGSEDVGIVGLS
jgi:hypothetical protein